MQDIVGRAIPARRLHEGKSLSEQALEEAMAERRSYIRSPPPERQRLVFLVRHGVQLDDESERELRDRLPERLVDRSDSLRRLKTHLPR